MYRTNAQSSPFEQILLSEGIPYKVVGAFKFFERMEVKDIVSYLKFLVNPKDSLSLQRIINTPNRAIGKTTLDSLQEIAIQNGVTFAQVVTHIDQYNDGIAPSVQSKIKQFVTLMQGIQQSIAFLTVAQLIEQLVNSIGYKAYLIKEDGEEK